MKAVLVQVGSTQDKDRNLQRALDLVREASEAGGRLVVFPEMFMGMPSVDHPPRVFAEPLEGPFVRGLASAARQNGVHVVCGVWELSDDPARPHNTAVVIAPDGQVAAAYRKVHLFDALGVRESEHMLPGTTLPPVFEVDGLQVGVAICFDLRFGEVFRELALRGARVIVVPAAWYGGPMKEDHWLTLLRARAIENTVYVVGANQVGERFCGRSAGFDPFGAMLADGGEREGLVVVPIEPSRVDEVRRKLPCLSLRRKDLYG